MRKSSIGERRGSVFSIDGSNRRGSLLNNGARKSSVLLDPETYQKVLRETEGKLTRALDMLALMERRHNQLIHDYEDVSQKMMETRLCAVDTAWRYAVEKSKDFAYLPKVDLSLVESDDQVGKYSLQEVLGKGQYSIVRACVFNQTDSSAGQHESPNTFNHSNTVSSEEKNSYDNSSNNNNNNNNNNNDTSQSERDDHFADRGIVKKKAATRFAVKIIAKENIASIASVLRVEQELKALRALCGSKNIVDFQEVLHGPKSLYIITESFPMDLFEFLEVHHVRLNENVAGVILRDLIEGVNHMASKGIVHRDLKPENVLISVGRNDIRVKICDFGLSTFLDSPNSILSEFCGSPGFFAPEVLLQNSFCVHKAEVFSLGCIALEMLVSQAFFSEVWMRAYSAVKTSDAPLFSRKIREAVMMAHSELQKSHSGIACDFLGASLNILPSLRQLTSKLRHHEWITRTNRITAADVINCRQPRRLVSQVTLRDCSIVRTSKGKDDCSDSSSDSSNNNNINNTNPSNQGPKMDEESKAEPKDERNRHPSSENIPCKSPATSNNCGNKGLPMNPLLIPSNNTTSIAISPVKRHTKKSPMDEIDSRLLQAIRNQSVANCSKGITLAPNMYAAVSAMERDSKGMDKRKKSVVGNRDFVAIRKFSRAENEISTERSFVSEILEEKALRKTSVASQLKVQNVGPSTSTRGIVDLLQHR